MLPGRYISKRERAASSLALNPSVTSSSSSSPLPGIGSISVLDIRNDMLLCLRQQWKSHGQLLPETLSLSLAAGHDKAVNALHWSPTHSSGNPQANCHTHAFASALSASTSDSSFFNFSLRVEPRLPKL